jgi:hypothetical protein
VPPAIASNVGSSRFRSVTFLIPSFLVFFTLASFCKQHGTLRTNVREPGYIIPSSACFMAGVGAGVLAGKGMAIHGGEAVAIGCGGAGHRTQRGFIEVSQSHFLDSEFLAFFSL